MSAATTLAEERDRGSLDVIMTTPLTTREIVWGKWWGTFAMVPRLAILPIWVACGAAMVSDGGVGLILMIGMILAYAAAITSAGLALATWVPRLGRVVSISVLGYVLITVGWPLLLQVLATLPAFRTAPWEPPPEWHGLSLASPFLGIYSTTEQACWMWGSERRLARRWALSAGFQRGTRSGPSSGSARTRLSPWSWCTRRCEPSIAAWVETRNELNRGAPDARSRRIPQLTCHRLGGQRIRRALSEGIQILERHESDRVFNIMQLRVRDVLANPNKIFK